ncbi:MAG: methyl-accepting chemotaxis protein [Treponema sp.]|nr:methyl-accepting chemotaxis protein [Candidatus Treponema caballi]
MWITDYIIAAFLGCSYSVKVFKQTIPADPFRIVQVFVHCLSCGLLMAMYTFFVKNFIFIESMDLVLIIPAVVIIIKVLAKRINYSSEVISMISGEGDISKRIDVTMTDDLGLMTGNTNALMDKLSLLLRELKKQSDNLTLSAEKLTQNADNSSDALSKMTGTLEKISSEGDSQQEMIISVNNAVGNLKKGLKNSRAVRY